MGAVMMVFLSMWAGSAYFGVKVMALAFPPTLDPDIPAARVVNTHGAEYAYQQTTDIAARGTRKLGKAIRIVLGLFLMIWPILLVYWFLMASPGFGAF